MIEQSIFKKPENFLEVLTEEITLLTKHTSMTRRDVLEMPTWERHLHFKNLIDYNKPKK